MGQSWAGNVREQISGYAGGTTAFPVGGGAPVTVLDSRGFLAQWGASGSGFYKARVGAQEEVGFGVLNAAGTSMVRDPIEGSSGDYTLVNFNAGVLDLCAVAPGDWLGSRMTEDHLLNGNGQIAQIALGSTADDVYSHDQWYALTQTAAITTSQLTDVEDGVPQMMRLTQGQAAAQRMGYAQIIESRDCKRLRGKRATFGGRLRCSSSQAIRFAILEHTGSADIVTSDVVNNWADGTFAAGNFFIAGPTVRAVGSLTPAANTLVDWRLSATLGSAFNNLVVMIWTEATAAQNVTLDFVAQLKRGFVVQPLVFRAFMDEIRLCERYFEKNYDYLSAPGSAVAPGAFLFVTVSSLPNFSFYGWIPYRTRKRISAPTVVIYGVQGGAGKVSDAAGTDLAAGSGTVWSGDTGETGFALRNQSGGTLTPAGPFVSGFYTSDARL